LTCLRLVPEISKALTRHDGAFGPLPDQIIAWKQAG
jgi:hypothetical protein